MNNDLISREALKQAIKEKFDNFIPEGVYDEIDNAPTFDLDEFYGKAFKNGEENALKIRDLEEKPQGEWIKNEHTFWTCSHCNWFNEMNRIKYNFCPNCGAYMQKGGAE